MSCLNVRELAQILSCSGLYLYNLQHITRATREELSPERVLNRNYPEWNVNIFSAVDKICQNRDYTSLDALSKIAVMRRSTVFNKLTDQIFHNDDAMIVEIIMINTERNYSYQIDDAIKHG